MYARTIVADVFRYKTGVHRTSNIVHQTLYTNSLSFVDWNRAAAFAIHDAFGYRAEELCQFEIDEVADRSIATAFDDDSLVPEFFYVDRCKVFEEKPVMQFFFLPHNNLFCNRLEVR